MDRIKIENSVSNLIEPILNEHGYEIVEVEFLESENSTLTVFIYKEGGISLNDCKIVNDLIDEPLDELDPTNNEPYSLNISSPGIDRPLKTIRDFERNLGNKINIQYKLENIEKSAEGNIKQIQNNIITINQKGKLIEIEFDSIIKALPVIEF